MNANTPSRTSPLRVGIGGPVGSGKTALTLALCQALRDKIDMAVVTNDIYTAEDAKFLVNHSALPPERIMGVETGGWPCVGPQPTSRAAAAPTAQRREIIAQVYGVTIVPAIQARPSSPPCGYRRGPQRTPVAWFGQ